MANPEKKLVTQFTVLVNRASLEKEKAQQKHSVGNTVEPLPRSILLFYSDLSKLKMGLDIFSFFCGLIFSQHCVFMF